MPRRTTPRLSEALVSYERIRAATYARSTILNDHSVLTRFLQGVGDPQCHLLESVACEEWFAGEAERQLPTSYNKVRVRVLAFLAFCTRRGWLDGDPMAEVRKRRTQARRPRLQLTGEQLRRMIETTANPRDRAMLSCGANTGLRSSDLCALRVGDIDQDQGYINIVIQKTQEADRLPITVDLDQELRRWLRWYTERLAILGVPLEKDMRLFPALGHCNVRRNGVMEQYGDPQPYRALVHPARVVHRGLERIGITETSGEGFHTLRRSVGRLVFEQASAEGHDASLRIAAAVLGHKNVATTEIYLGVSHDRVKRDAMLKGRSFLSQDLDNVVRLDGYEVG